MAEIWLTQEEFDKRKEHLEYLKSTRTLEIAEMLKIARGFGDLSENAEYDAAKAEQQKNEIDIATLEDELRQAKIIDHSHLNSDIVNVGSRVVVRYCETGAEAAFEIVGTAAADPMHGKISNESPIGGALLGKEVGDVVPVTTPGGQLHLEILSIGK
ncbi:MAG: transcription elongation factor GreA [Clostridia bacterium]|jgi:transcription elongation factor GreA|nr:transcription elongation factor GreA [Clostridia bacterium]